MVCSNPWSVVSLAHFITNQILIFYKHTTSYHSIYADGFGVCFEMGKKFSKMLSLSEIPTASNVHLDVCSALEHFS